MKIIKYKKVKFGTYQGGWSVFLSFNWLDFYKLSQLYEPTSWRP